VKQTSATQEFLREIVSQAFQEGRRFEEQAREGRGDYDALCDISGERLDVLAQTAAALLRSGRVYTEAGEARAVCESGLSLDMCVVPYPLTVV
jgi:hypothetical protein